MGVYFPSYREKRRKNEAMKISTKGRYGLRILIDLATHDPEKPRMLKDIAQMTTFTAGHCSAQTAVQMQ